MGGLYKPTNVTIVKEGPTSKSTWSFQSFLWGKCWFFMMGFSYFISVEFLIWLGWKARKWDTKFGSQWEYQ
jgi:hypothetical protein